MIITFKSYRDILTINNANLVSNITFEYNKMHIYLSCNTECKFSHLKTKPRNIVSKIGEGFGDKDINFVNIHCNDCLKHILKLKKN